MKSKEKPLTAILVGNPNTGKTAIFNALTGKNYKSTNYPGVTVECRTGNFFAQDKKIDLVDLPGLYSLNAQTFDEKIARDFIFNKSNNYLSKSFLNTHYDYIFMIVDSTRLEKSLYLAQELKSLNLPIILLLNMCDLSCTRGQIINTKGWSKYWNVPIFEICAHNLESFQPLKLFLATQEKSDSVSRPDWDEYKSSPEVIASHFKQIDTLVDLFVEKKIAPDSITQWFDRYFLHPVYGNIFFGFLMLLLFQLLFTLSAPLQDAIGYIFDQSIVLIQNNLAPTFLRDFLTQGLIAGLGAIVVFLPQITLLSLFMMILEDTGYLARVAFLLDSTMRRLALPGKAIIPLLSSHACAIPGIMATRTLEHEEDRLTTILVAPLTSCSARVPVYTLLIAALVPSTLYWGPLKVQAVFMLLLYLLGIIMSFVVAFILKKKVFHSTARHLLLELPSFKLPRLKNLYFGVSSKVGSFLKKASGIIVGLSALLWLLTSFPKNAPIEESYAARIGKTLSPIFSPMDFDWKLTAALIPSFAAREVMVSAMATMNSIEIENDSENSTALTEIIRSEYSIATIFALLIWFVFAPQCISTFAAIKNETHGYYWATVAFTYTLVLAYLMSLLAYWSLAWL
jgi:ferrous iron transport protein B